ncbi:MAG: hypothetical protein AVDCRST_MAG07-1632 [uncultured Frankineae bacterium]|uniref:Low molecular weight protein antigen 6 PH domain-containing protein n=1 Tax=uncultured Frankineae bacterium TaxID=437475 RepID=A0A6J4KZT6_9ACTN|nr:MAG: hypothetical protein AVDCRST_MAG07-1632 [uncultured Frankineae bacterium]
MTTPQTAGRRRFGPDRIALLPVLVLFLGSLPLAASSGWLNGVVLLPVACAVWVLRARVVVAPAGLGVCNGLAMHRLPWSAVEGFSVPRRGFVRLLRSGARPLPMTALSRRDLPALRDAASELGRARPQDPPAGG